MPASYDLDDIIKPIRTALSAGPVLYALPFYGESSRYQAVAQYAASVLTMLEGANLQEPTLPPSPYVGIQYVPVPSFAEFGNAIGSNVAALVGGKPTIDEIGALNQAQVVKTFAAAEAK